MKYQLHYNGMVFEGSKAEVSEVVSHLSLGVEYSIMKDVTDEFPTILEHKQARIRGDWMEHLSSRIDWAKSRLEMGVEMRGDKDTWNALMASQDKYEKKCGY